MHKLMISLTFNKRNFFKTILLFLILSAVWTFTCIQANEFTDIDRGFITGFGFLLLFSASLYFGQNRKPLRSFILLAVITIVIFLIGTFILGPLIGLSTDSMVLYAVINSLFVSISMTLTLNKIYGINLRYLTMALTFIMLLIAYLLISKFDEDDNYYLKYGVYPRMVMFNIFQFMLLIPLTIGITIKKASA